MNKVIPAFICVAFILMLTGCKKKKFNDAIYDTIGQKIEMDIHKQDPTQFTILRYIDNPPCTSCQLKLGEWKVYYKKMKKMFGDKVGLYFLTETKNIEDAKFLFKIYGFDNVSVVDSSMNKSIITLIIKFFVWKIIITSKLSLRKLSLLTQNRSVNLHMNIPFVFKRKRAIGSFL